MAGGGGSDRSLVTIPMPDCSLMLERWIISVDRPFDNPLMGLRIIMIGIIGKIDNEFNININSP